MNLSPSNKTALTEHATIGTLVAEDYRKAEVFKKYGLDFCCGGGRSIAKACEVKGLDQNQLMEDLRAVDSQPRKQVLDYNSWSLDFLVDFIVKNHHKYVHENLPLIRGFAQKVAKVHGHASPEVVEINKLFGVLADELHIHMIKEENILFPFIKGIALAKVQSSPVPKAPFGTIANPIEMMENEHESAGDIIKEIARVSNNYTPPEHACTTWRVLYSKLEEFETDLFQHIHLENNILFPKALKMEAESRKS